MVRRRSPEARIWSVLVSALVVLIALTWYLATGERADGLCDRAFFVSGGEWSWSHLAVECEYGLPIRSGYARPWPFYLLLMLAIAGALLAFAQVAQRQRDADQR